MTDPKLGLVQRYRSQGVLVDTNILLLYFVGGFDRTLIPRFKRTDRFTSEDYDRLVRLLAMFQGVVTTPNILSEVNSLSGQIGEPARTGYFHEFAKGIRTLDEHYIESANVCQSDRFAKLGLTDSAILHLAKDKYLVLTDDFTLCQFLQKAGIDVLNFNHIRSIE